jgi:UDP-N-acetyl-D-glucosamine dehydrogenase
MKTTATLRRRILDRRAKVAVVGQGYVGVSLASAAADAGFPVLGVDTDAARVADLSDGRLTVPGVDEALFRAGVAAGTMTFTTDIDELAGAEIVLVCVPTPLRDSSPDLSHVENACRDVGAELSPGALVVLESTTYPGTTDDVVRPILETKGQRAGKDFLLAYSPERVDPGNGEWGLRNTPKVVGGHSAEATGLATLFYGQFIDKVVSVSSCRAAELAKLLENTFRHVNIALVNELAMLCHETGTDVWEVIDAAATKPFGFMSFTPGPGVGGHCIPLDPAYLAWQVRRDVGHQFQILEQAQDVNARVPRYVAGRIGEMLNDVGKPMKGSRVYVLGVSYKSDVGDLRESPSLRVMNALYRSGATVTFHDPYVDSVSVNGHTLARTELSNRAVRSADCVALLTPHSAYDLTWLADNARLVFDARNAFGPDRRGNVIRL